jgi:prephenate dehydrogenase
MPLFNRVTIIGLGLIGGSLGMAIRRNRLARTVVGFSRKGATLRRAKARGAIDLGTTSIERAVRDAELVILCSPVDTIIPLAKRIAPLMRDGSILSDVGSTKGHIVAILERALPPGIPFVGAHPLAGSEQRGIKAAKAKLFDGSVCIVTANRRTDPRALGLVSRLWKSLVARVMIMEPQRHDRLLAAVSHLPHLLAFCLLESTEASALKLAPRSFLDATRVAKSDPKLWDDILLTNRLAIVDAIVRFERRWHTLRTHVLRGDRAKLCRFLASAHAKCDVLQH